MADEYRGRIFGALNAVQAIAMLFGMILASGLRDRLGVVPMLEVDAAFNILAGVLAFILIRKVAKPVPSPEIELVTEHGILEADTAMPYKLGDLTDYAIHYRCCHRWRGRHRLRHCLSPM